MNTALHDDSTSKEEHADEKIEVETKDAGNEPIKVIIEGDDRVHVLRSRMCQMKVRLGKTRIGSTPLFSV